MAKLAEEIFMRRAIELAQQGRGIASPNPMVGAVIVCDGKILSEGFHSGPGNPHAEIEALNNLPKRSRAATLYINLEPCCHLGRTGPCTEQIIKSKIKEVVVAIQDPNPLVNGGGIAALKEAGITVRTGLLKDDAELLNDAYLGYHRNKRPFVILKLAQSLDGRIATSNGDSKWISSESSRTIVHKLRSEVDAVIIGRGTLQRDNPKLTVREVKGKNPYRIIVTSSGKLPAASKVLLDNADNKTIIATTAEGAEKIERSKISGSPIIWTVAQNAEKSGVDLRSLLQQAYEFGLQSIMVEGGSALATSFVNDQLVDKMIFFIAPIIVGRGINSMSELNVKTISEAVEFDRSMFIDSGDDLCFVGYPRRN